MSQENIDPIWKEKKVQITYKIIFLKTYPKLGHKARR